MYHLKLIKGMSYTNGIISATQKKPDIYTEDKTTVDMAVKSGYFNLLESAENQATEGEKNQEREAHLEEMTVSNLKKLAADMGIDATGLKNKADYVAAIAAHEVVPDAENDQATEGKIDYGEE